MSDTNTICDEVRARYAEDDRLPHPAEVAVAERAGTVLLRGTVRSLRQRQAAVEIARSVRGVRDVTDSLKIDPRDHWEDQELRGTALQALMSRADVPADQIDVTVDRGWLTLKGQVKHQYDSDAAFEAVAEVPRVGGITNEIKVVTAGGH
jgi:osmotically-inducible protein OsmY